jgi:hypothetical protein
MDMKKFSIIATLTLASAFAAHAQFLELNISSDCNQNLQTVTDRSHQFLVGTLALVPEPSPLLLLGLGALVLGARLTRQ